MTFRAFHFLGATFLTLWSLNALSDHERLLIPETIEWKYTASIGETTREFTFPRDKPMLGMLPNAFRPQVLEDVKRREENQKTAREKGKQFFSLPNIPGKLVPDYTLGLREVAISISFQDSLEKDPLHRAWPLLKALPEYTKIHIVMPTSVTETVKAALKKEGFAKRTVLRPVAAWNRAKDHNTPYSRTTRWIRDTFLVGTSSEGKPVAFKPLAYAAISNLARSDLSFLNEAWFKRDLVIPIPGFIRGGNVGIADNTAGRRVAFMGHDEINQNEKHYQSTTGVTPPRDLVPEILKRIAGVNQVEVNMTFDPPWGMEMMSDEARLELGFM